MSIIKGSNKYGIKVKKRDGLACVVIHFNFKNTSIEQIESFFEDLMADATGDEPEEGKPHWSNPKVLVDVEVSN